MGKWVKLWWKQCSINNDHIYIINIGGKSFLRSSPFPWLPNFLQKQSSLLSVLVVVVCLVLSGLLTYISVGGLYTEAEKTAVIWPLGAWTFFPLTAANSPKRGKTKFSWRCNAVYYQQFETKILGNFRKSQLALLFWRFDGLHHNIVLPAFSFGTQKTWLAVVLHCTCPFSCSLLLTGSEH